MARRDAVSQRERRVVMSGAAIVLFALFLTYGVMPFIRQWRVREDTIAATRDRVALLQQLEARTAQLQVSAADAERALASKSRRVMHARSTTLAASALQSLLQDMADGSQVVVTRLEVSADDSTSSGIPAVMSAYGDITGVATFLERVAGGPRVLVLDRLAVQRNAALLGAQDVVQFTMTVRAPVLMP